MGVEQVFSSLESMLTPNKKRRQEELLKTDRSHLLQKIVSSVVQESYKSEESEGDMACPFITDPVPAVKQ